MLSVMVHVENAIMQAGLESILRSHPDLSVVGSSSNSVSLLQKVEELQPDVLLLESLGEDNESGWETLQALGNGLSSPAIVILADFEESDRPLGASVANRATDALKLGVRAILPRNASTDEITAAVVAAATGLVVLHPDFVEDLLPRNELSVTVLPTSPIQALTPREIEVLGMLAQGLGNKTIAQQMGISEHTVKFHVSSIFSKLNASSRTEAVTLGARLGLILL
jgi:DNA-binding NarL/FixJ family response regulator